MKSLLIKVVVNALAIWVAAALLNPGIHVDATGSKRIVTFLVVGAIFGVVNAIIKPIVKLFSLPLIVLSLGLFVFIINAAMLQLVSAISGELGIDFQVEHFFWDAILGAVIVSVVSMALNLILPDGD